MASLVFDIETVGENFETDFNKYEQDYLLKYAESETDKEEFKLRTALSPLTGQAIVVSYMELHSGKAAVDMVSDKGSEKEIDGAKVTYLKTEQELLTRFWKMVAKYEQIVTFNGRNFDVPFLMIRSAVHGLRPSKNLLGYRFEYAKHCDLAEQLSFYGALRYPRTLHFYTRAFHIPSPKEEMEGREVTNYYNQGKHHEIAAYGLKDVQATAKLFQYWHDYLRF